eukprot:3671450-Rhodomonas_salina.1
MLLPGGETSTRLGGAVGSIASTGYYPLPTVLRIRSYCPTHSPLYFPTHSLLLSYAFASVLSYAFRPIILLSPLLHIRVWEGAVGSIASTGYYPLSIFLRIRSYCPTHSLLLSYAFSSVLSYAFAPNVLLTYGYDVTHALSSYASVRAMPGFQLSGAYPLSPAAYALPNQMRKHPLTVQFARGCASLQLISPHIVRVSERAIRVLQSLARRMALTNGPWNGNSQTMKRGATRDNFAMGQYVPDREHCTLGTVNAASLESEQ